MKYKYDYCGKEFEEGDGIKDADYCCNDCWEDICEVCLEPITPGESEAYMCRCRQCADKDIE